MFEMLNMYQQQIDLINRIKPINPFGLAQITQKALDSVNGQMIPMQSIQIADFRSRMEELVRPFTNLTLNQEFTKASSPLVSMQNYFNSINKLYDNLNISVLNTLAQSISIQKSAFEDFSQSMSKVQMNNYSSTLHRVLDRIPDSVYETILEDEDYKKQDIEDELGTVETESSSFSIEGLSPDDVQQYFWKELWIKHPKLASVLVKIIIVLTAVSATKDAVSFLEDIVIPAYHTAIVYLHEKENSYFIKVDYARIYEEPNSHSSKLANALYGDEVYKLEDIKMWLKVSYKTEEGNTITGWIAKRNLMPYSDYEFNSNELYEE